MTTLKSWETIAQELAAQLLQKDAEIQKLRETLSRFLTSSVRLRPAIPREDDELPPTRRDGSGEYAAFAAAGKRG